MTTFVELNNFVRADNGVFGASSDARQFDYSDGQQTEATLEQILRAASDLSSDSDELQTQIIDWPTEYHLSKTRANLLRALDLSGVTRVLELGCGCGSITRYLGEHRELIIDSVEGSPSRAALAALRCRDLENVTISTANFNEVDFPKNYYDLVLFVGVTEYAGRFSERSTDQEALQDLLRLGKTAATSEGVVLIAIENRLGLKYLHGACEDHYAQPNVGLADYPNSSGIRTYSKKQWQHQIEIAGFASCEYLYPFPDYKVPTVLLNDAVLADHSETNDAVRNAVNHIRSRDYVGDFDLGDREALLWRSLLDAGTLAEHANSFLLLMSNSKESVDAMAAFSIARFDAPALSYLDKKDKANVTGTGTAKDSSQTESIRDDQLIKQIDGLKSHAENLQNTIDIMVGSVGWRCLNRLRRLFGRPSIK